MSPDGERTFISGRWVRRGAPLSDRERAVVLAYIELGSQKVVAHEMGLSLQTVKNHVSVVLWKLNVHSITQAAIIVDREARPSCCPVHPHGVPT